MIIHQPFHQNLGDQIIQNLQAETYFNFHFIVAYAKTSGVNPLLPSMREFKNAGGHIFGVVGIDQYNTSYEALTSLCDVCDELYIYHSMDPNKTFHVKSYIFSNDSDVWAAIGSHNFTAGGFYNNYEACLINVSDDPEFRSTVFQLYQSYSDPLSPCCILSDQELIELLLREEYIKREHSLIEQRITETTRERNRHREHTIFGRDTFRSHAPVTHQDQGRQVRETPVPNNSEIETI